MDIQTFWDAAGVRGDWRLAAAGQLSAGQDLKTAALISLFTWRRARADDTLPDAAGGRKGWWGDAITRRPIGSRLWLLQREKQTRIVVQRAKEYADEALAWLVEDKVCSSIEVVAEIAGPGVLGLQCGFVREGRPNLKFRFDFAWANLQLVNT
ncbi:Mu-like prophage protein gp46 [Duganella sp. CF458]|uniref:phage GP46 family protein n=1 Tax=Duganella sp. CF458 TaxID=1884368 RepID=UPI0008E732B7|nr:phage GP46 family protein [Duganella sp. CF458]SFG29428.1 Mu-like prophage protein gp46 [Duganella sp. CF458]